MVNQLKRDFSVYLILIKPILMEEFFKPLKSVLIDTTRELYITVEKTKRRLCKLTWHDRFRQRLDDRFSFKRRKFCRRRTVVVVDVVALPLFGDAAPFRRICDVSCCCCRRCLGWTRSPGRLDPSWLRSGFVVANCCVGLNWFGRTSNSTFRATRRRLTFAVDDRL